MANWIPTTQELEEWAKRPARTHPPSGKLAKYALKQRGKVERLQARVKELERENHEWRICGEDIQRKSSSPPEMIDATPVDRRRP